MVALSSLIFVMFLSLIVVRIGAEALTLTGLSRQEAKFQARSAWTGTGFTTSEAESRRCHRSATRFGEPGNSIPAVRCSFPAAACAWSAPMIGPWTGR